MTVKAVVLGVLVLALAGAFGWAFTQGRNLEKLRSENAALRKENAELVARAVDLKVKWDSAVSDGAKWKSDYEAEKKKAPVVKWRTVEKEAAAEVPAVVTAVDCGAAAGQAAGLVHAWWDGRPQ